MRTTPEIGTQLVNALDRGREYFNTLADAMPQLIWTASADGTIDFFNARWIAYTGITLDDFRSGVRGSVHPDDLALTMERWRTAVESQTPYEIEYRLRRGTDHEFRWFLARAEPVRNGDGHVALWVGTATDIDEQRRDHDSLEFVSEAVDAFSGSLDADEICRRFARLAVRRFADWCFVTLFEPPDLFETVAAVHRDAQLAMEVEAYRKAHPVRRRPRHVVEALMHGPVLVPNVTPENMEAAAEDLDHLRLLRSMQMHSLMVLPLKGPAGQLYGAITLASAESRRQFTASDLAVAERTAARASAALHTARVFGLERQAAARLRFIAKASALLFASLDLKSNFQRLLDLIVSEIADFALIATIEGDGLRTISVAHHDPASAAVTSHLRGQRWLHSDAEAALIARLRAREPYTRQGAEIETVAQSERGYLSADLAQLKPVSEIVVPLHARGMTYGALFAYYSDSGRTYTRADLPLFLDLGHRASIAIEMAQSFERERRIAATLQVVSLPAALPRAAGLRFEGVYSPASDEGSVGGDWYDVVPLDDGSVMISVGDVAGRGVEAAAIMAKVRHVMGILPLYEDDPTRILDSADWMLRRRHPDSIVTAFVGIISPDRKSIRFANAGHPFPLARRGNRLFELRSSGVPLGMRALTKSAASEQVDLAGVNLLVLYTDGLIEWGRNVLEGEKRLRRILRSDAILHAHRPAGLVHDYCLRAAPRDDVAVLAVALNGGETWNFDAEDARSARDARSAFVKYLKTRTGDAACIASAEMVFGELVANVARHAPGPISVQVDWSGERPIVHVIDRGPAFRAHPKLPDDALSENGRGLYLIGKATAKVHIERLPGFGNHVSVMLPLEPRPG